MPPPRLKAFIKEQRTASRTRERTASTSASLSAGPGSDGDALAASPDPGAHGAAGTVPALRAGELPSPYAMLLQLQKERDESLTERGNLVRQVVTRTDNYEDMVTGKLDEIERLLSAADEKSRMSW